MTFTTLKDSPHLYQTTLALIEKSFHYDSKHSFAVDFAPLMDKSNHHNCFVLTDESGAVVGHIGACERKLLGETICLLGGIAIDEEKRGEGHFQSLMMEVMSEKKSDVALFLLWSDKEKLYKKFGFYLCGTQFQHRNSMILPAGYTKTKFSNLGDTEKKEVQNLYRESFCKKNHSIERKFSDWDLCEKITSADLYLKKNGTDIHSYFFMNKGQDLQETIFEYGSKELDSELLQMATYGNLWAAEPVTDSDEAQYQFMLCPGETKAFGAVVEKFTNSQMKIEGLSSVKQEVYFHFNDELLGLDIEEFLRGVFGPGMFEELGNLKPVFISGLDSI